MPEHHYLPLHWDVPAVLWHWGENKNNTSLETALTSGALSFTVPSIRQMILTQSAAVALSCDFLGRWLSPPWRPTCVLLFCLRGTHQSGSMKGRRLTYCMETVLQFSAIGIVNIHQCRQVNNSIIHSCNPGDLWLTGPPCSLPLVLWLTGLFLKFQVPFTAPASALMLQDSFTFTEFISCIYQEWYLKVLSSSFYKKEKKITDERDHFLNAIQGKSDIRK